MASTDAAFLFENGEFVEFADGIADPLNWAATLQANGYSAEAQVWGHYPNVYLAVHEAEPEATSGFRFVAQLMLVRRPHRVYLRDMGSLIRLIGLLTPVFAQHQPDALSEADALFGMQGADQSENL